MAVSGDGGSVTWTLTKRPRWTGDLRDAGTISCWFKADANQTIFSCTGLWFGIDGGVPGFYLDSTPNWWGKKGTTTVTDSAWHHVVCTWDYDTAYVVVDGTDETAAWKTGAAASAARVDASPFVVSIEEDDVLAEVSYWSDAYINLSTAANIGQFYCRSRSEASEAGAKPTWASSLGAADLHLSIGFAENTGQLGQGIVRSGTFALDTTFRDNWTYKVAKRWAYEKWDFCVRCGFEHPESELIIEPHTGAKVCTRWPNDYDLPGKDQLGVTVPTGVYY